MPEYEYLIVGAGLFGSVFANEARKKGKSCFVIDQRNHIGGNCYTENNKGIEVHKYGAHIFHTSNKKIWDYINKIGTFYPFIHSPVAVIGNKTYNLPFNMNTFSKVFNKTKPNEVLEIIEKERHEIKGIPQNLEEQAIKLVGRTIYEIFIKNYTEKQWDKPCTELPIEIIKRLPMRFTYNNNYFDDIYQGIPEKGYTNLFRELLKGIPVLLNTPYRKIKRKIKAKKIIYTGMIDEFFDYRFGELEYRSLKFVEIEKDLLNYQGTAVINYPSKNIEYIRSIEHKHFYPNNKINHTVVTYEFSVKHRRGMDAFYPVNDRKNQIKYNDYMKLAKETKNIYFSGRLGGFKYYDMDDTIEHSLELARRLL